jgi:hypothetical protein
VPLAHRPHRRDRRGHPEGAIEPASGLLGVDVGASDDGRPGFASAQPAPDVADGVALDLEPSFRAPPRHVVLGGHPLRGVDEAVDPGLTPGTEAGKFADHLLNDGRVDRL